jgi:pSer/pThr/pTyr-binding forkhead associated (FHA) protein
MPGAPSPELPGAPGPAPIQPEQTSSISTLSQIMPIPLPEVGGHVQAAVIPLTGGELIVGREAADIVLRDPMVSRRHARVARGPEGYFVEDFGSKNGTFVAGQRITRAVLQPGAEIVFGRSLVSFDGLALHVYDLANVATIDARGLWRVIPGKGDEQIVTSCPTPARCSSPVSTSTRSRRRSERRWPTCPRRTCCTAS